MTERFWPQVDRKGPDECWNWMGFKNSAGYGRLRVDGRKELAHRVSWSDRNGAIPNGLCVLHRCDNPACVNPSHLFLGTRTVNNADRHSKGRSGAPHGEKSSFARFRDDQIPYVCALLKAGLSQSDVARAYGVHKGTISHIARGGTWGHITKGLL